MMITVMIFYALKMYDGHDYNFNGNNNKNDRFDFYDLKHFQLGL